MKAFFCFFTVALLATACNNSADGGDTKKDSALQAIDSLEEVKKDSITVAHDSLSKKVEATYEATDSANDAKADSAARTGNKGNNQ